MTRDSDRNGDSRQDRDGLGPKGESAGLEEASPNSSHRPEDVGLVEKVARAMCVALNAGKPITWEKLQSEEREVYFTASTAAISILTPYTVDEAREVMAREMTKGFGDDG